MVYKSVKAIWKKFAKHYPRLSLWIAKWNWVGLMLAGVAVQGAHEYAIALALLIAGAISITFSSFYWNGITDFPRFTKFSRILIFIFGVTLLPVSYLWILNVKIDNPWSNLISHKRLLSAQQVHKDTGGSTKDIKTEQPKTPILETTNKKQLTATATTKDTENVEKNESPIDKLTQLGWDITHDEEGIRFSISYRSLPDMVKSAQYFKKIHEPFELSLNSAKGIVGLRHLSGTSYCKRIVISAGEFTDLSDLSALSDLTELRINQTPINGFSILNLSPIANLVNLQKLNLDYSRITDISPLSKLTRLKILNLNNTLIRDATPLSTLTMLESLDLTNTEIINLSPLTGMTRLKHLSVSGKQLADLNKLSHINSLVELYLIDQNNVDLMFLAKLTQLKSLFIWGPPRINLSPLRSLTNLQHLDIRGFGINTLSSVTDIDSISTLKELNQLGLGFVNVSNLAFLGGLLKLKELSIDMVPINSIEPLRGLHSLNIVVLMSVPVVDISPLLDLPALSKVFLSRTPARADVLTELERRGVKVQR